MMDIQNFLLADFLLYFLKINYYLFLGVSHLILSQGLHLRRCPQIYWILLTTNQHKNVMSGNVITAVHGTGQTGVVDVTE